MLRVTILWFGVLRERRGCTEEQIDVANGTTVRSLYRTLCPPQPEGELPVGFARNGDHVGPDSLIEDGDVVVFLPPVGGG